MGRSGTDRHKEWPWGGVPPTPFLLGLWIRVHLLQAGVGSFSRASALRSGGMWAVILLAADCSGISLETLSLAETWRREWEASLWSQAQFSPTKFHQERSPEGGPMEQHHLLIWSFREKGRASVIGPSERCQLSANLQCSQTHLLQLGIRGEVQTTLRDSSLVFCVGSSGLRQLEKGENMSSGVREIPFWQVTYQLCNFGQVLSPVRVSRVTFMKWGLKRPASGDYGEDWVRWWKWTDWQSLLPQSSQGWSSNSHKVWCLPSLLLFGFFFLLTKD